MTIRPCTAVAGLPQPLQAQAITPHTSTSSTASHNNVTTGSQSGHTSTRTQPEPQSTGRPDTVDPPSSKRTWQSRSGCACTTARSASTRAEQSHSSPSASTFRSRHTAEHNEPSPSIVRAAGAMPPSPLPHCAHCPCTRQRISPPPIAHRPAASPQTTPQHHETAPKKNSREQAPDRRPPTTADPARPEPDPPY